MQIETNQRQEYLGLMARAVQGKLSALLGEIDSQASFEFLRKPEIGSVMVRGRAGGTGAPFNLGEMTVTRCSIKLAGGQVGHAYVQGRRKEDAQSAALVDALMQTNQSAQIEAKVLEPLRELEVAAKKERAQKAAATKVDFFTMARGED